MSDYYKEAVTLLFRAQVKTTERKARPQAIKAYKPTISVQSTHGSAESPPPKTVSQRTTVRVGRNEPCPCGSGKKYKKCCGQNE